MPTQHFDTSCLYSTVRNTSGVRKKFMFLPPHGRELAADEEFTVFGDVAAAVVKDVERATSRRHIVAFENAIERGDMIIVHSPAPILQDHTTGLTKMLRLNGGTLGAVDPCWSNSIHSTPADDYN